LLKVLNINYLYHHQMKITIHMTYLLEFNFKYDAGFVFGIGSLYV
jgi:hypothetical protein